MEESGTGVLSPDFYNSNLKYHNDMFQFLNIALEQLKAGNKSESLLNQIR